MYTMSLRISPLVSDIGPIIRVMWWIFLSAFLFFFYTSFGCVHTAERKRKKKGDNRRRKETHPERINTIYPVFFFLLLLIYSSFVWFFLLFLPVFHPVLARGYSAVSPTHNVSAHRIEFSLLLDAVVMVMKLLDDEDPDRRRKDK